MQNEFACKVSEQLAGSDNKDGKRGSPQASGATSSKVDVEVKKVNNKSEVTSGKDELDSKVVKKDIQKQIETDKRQDKLDDVAQTERGNLIHSDKSDVTKTGKGDVPKAEKIDVTKAEKSDVTKIENSDAARADKIDAAKVEQPNQTNALKSQASDVSKTIESNVIKTDKIEIVKANEPEVSTTEKPVVDKADSSGVAKVDKSSDPEKDKSDVRKGDASELTVSDEADLTHDNRPVETAQTSDGIDDLNKDTTNDDSNNENVDESGQETLHYEPGQYNPKTKKGKRKYDKKFLLAIGRKIDEDTKSLPVEGYPTCTVDFTPYWQQKNNQSTNLRSNDPLRRPNQPYYSGRNSDRQERQKKIIPTSSLGQEVELKTVSNPWKPASVVKDEVKIDESVLDIENLKKQFRSILNKLTPNNFDSLAAKVTNLNIDTEEKLGEVIDIVFAKALSEPGYSILYGRMCCHLKEISAGKAEFGPTLLKRCQNQFQADIYSGIDIEGRKKIIDEEEEPEKKKQLSEELYEDKKRCRMRGLGLIKFIGELYKIGMLNDTIMYDCIFRLLMDISDESLECLCDLLATIGEKLDESSKEHEKQMKTKPRNQGASRANAYQGGQKSAAAIVAQGPVQPIRILSLDPIFENLHKIRKDPNNQLSVRIKFKILDICELRERNNWQSKTKNDPKKLDEIRDAHLEKLESERRRDAMGPRRSQEGGRRGGLGHSSGSSSQISSLANDQGGNRGGLHMSASSQSIRDHSSSDNMRSLEHFESDKAVGLNLIKNVCANVSSGGTSSGSGSLRPNQTFRKS